MMSQLPQPLNDFTLNVDGSTVKIRLQMKLKATENEEVQLSGVGIRTWIPVTIPRRVNKIESLKGYILESSDSTRYFIFTSRESASDFVQQRGEGRAAQAEAIGTHRKARDEAEAQLAKARAEVADLETRIASVEARFLDSESNIAYAKAQTDLVSLGKKIGDLKAKIAKPPPRQGMGSAIAIQFGCDSILTRGEITAAVNGERVKLISRYKGLPDASEIPMGRRVILMIGWKQPN